MSKVMLITSISMNTWSNDKSNGVRQLYVGRRLVFYILCIKFLRKLDKKLDSRQKNSCNCKIFLITCEVKIYINKITGSQRGYAKTSLGLATLPVI